MIKKSRFLDLWARFLYSRAYFANGLNSSGSLEKGYFAYQPIRLTTILFNRFWSLGHVNTTGFYNCYFNDLITPVSISIPTIVPQAAGLIRLSSTSITLNFAI